MTTSKSTRLTDLTFFHSTQLAPVWRAEPINQSFRCVFPLGVTGSCGICILSLCQTKNIVQSQVEKAIEKISVPKFGCHNYRNSALTEWARRGINVGVAMKASGH